MSSSIINILPQNLDSSHDAREKLETAITYKADIYSAYPMLTI